MFYNHALHHYYLKNKYIDGLAQDCSNSIANVLQLLQSCAKTLMLCVKKRRITSQITKFLIHHINFWHKSM